MNARSCRPFTLLDAMILVAATALDLAGFRAELGHHYHRSLLYVLQDGKEYQTLVNWPGNAVPRWYLSIYTGGRLAARSVPMLASWSLALLVIRLRRPRPSRQPLFRQPGMVAGCAVALAVATNALFCSVQVLLAGLGQSALVDVRYYGSLAYLCCQTFQGGPIGLAVLASWTILALSGRWRREPGWIDRAGSVLGGIWIAYLSIDWAGQKLN